MELEDIVRQLGQMTGEAIAIARFEGGDRSPLILWCNDALCAMTGYAREELIGHRTAKLRRLADLTPIDPGLLAAWQRGEETVTEMPIWRRDGTELWVEHRVRPVLADGRLRFLVGFRHDVTERVRWRRALEAEAARLRAERARLSAEAARLERLSLVATHTNDGVLFLDREGRIEWANRAYLRRTGQRLEDVVGRKARNLISNEGLTAEEIAAVDARLAAGETLRLERQYRAADGRPYWVDLTVQPIQGPDGAIVSTVAIGRDITARKEGEAKMAAATARAEAAERRLWSAIEAIPDGFVIYDSYDRLVVCNQRYRELYALSADAIRVGASFEEILRAGLARGQYPAAEGREEEWLAERLAAHRRAEGTIEQRLADGRWVKIVERRTSIGDIVGFRVDITDLKRQQEQLEAYAAQLEQVNLEIAEKHAMLELSQEAIRHNALHDALTGLPNRRYLDERLRECLSDPAADVALFHLDLDRFKQINDTLGHAAGDAVLVAVAERLRKSVRAGDFVARIGGDEFIVLCPQATSREELARLADRLVAQMREPVRFEKHVCHFGCSIGIAVRRAGEPGGDLMVNADVALYRAKNRGRNRWEFYSDQLHAEIIARKRLSDEIVAGIDRNAFLPVYQPQVCLLTGRVLGVEALARWRRADGRMATPAEFLDVAEDLDLIARLDRMILEKALDDLARWRAAGLEVPRVSVNVSARRLHDPRLVEDVRALGIQPGTVAFELLESIYLDQPDGQLMWTLDALRDLGIAIELDDFGTGYASVVSLVRLRPDAIKIDQELIAPIAERSEAFDLVCALVSIGGTLGVKVLAEGVETPAQLELLGRTRCHAVQGHIFGRPMPAEELAALLDQVGGRFALGALAAGDLATGAGI
ncbi:MAG: EAL domain-containing protein [Alphaproteobacteria bacterium]|nr:MAG: EAL domain-containing protein [Alphaproteobacteria bacterium]